MSGAYDCINECEYELKRDRNKQIGGRHYSKHKIQPIDIIDEYSMNFFEGNALKYILRYKEKNGVQDLEKAKDYIDMIIERYKKESE